ncbi:MAG: outer membrane lipoprotein carrier protein LolA [Proteobacteria bacterium]|nr:outer membrane lipoprotein carrier protein LolA [Pseudomonadota bacterium]
MNPLIRLIRTIPGAASLAALCVCPAAPALAGKPAATAPAPADLERAVAALRAIGTMRADFLQTDGNGQRSTGVVSLKRPGKIRFQYAPGNPLLILSDGHALILIDSEVHQIQRWPIGNSPLGALLDPNRDVARYGTLRPTGDASVVSVEVKDRAHPEYGVMTLVFIRKADAPGGLELSAWFTMDAQGRRTIIQLSNQRYGMALSDDLFRYLDTRARPHK